MMERVTLRIPPEQLSTAERLVDEGYYPNLSEALRNLIDDGLAEHRGVGR